MDDDYQRHIDAGEAFVLELDGSVVALLVLVGHADHLLIDNVAVDPLYQGRSLGRALLGWAEARARSQGLPELRLFTHARMERNVEFYRRIDFAITHRAMVDGFDRVFMRKALPDC